MSFWGTLSDNTLPLWGSEGLLGGGGVTSIEGLLLFGAVVGNENPAILNILDVAGLLLVLLSNEALKVTKRVSWHAIILKEKWRI